MTSTPDNSRTLAFRGGTVVSPRGVEKADVLVTGGKISAVGDLPQQLPPETVEVDVTGRLVLPGGVDVHTHLDSPLNGATTADDFRTGSIAAACGGTTSIVDFSPQERGRTLGESLALHQERARGRSMIDYGMHQCLTDLDGGSVTEIQALSEQGVSSLKVFMAYRGTLMLTDDELREVFAEAARVGAQVCIHAEDGDEIDRLADQMVQYGQAGAKGHYLSRPPETEVSAVHRAIALAQESGVHIYFVHISTQGAVEAIAQARGEGRPVAGETCTHYLMLDPDVYDLEEEQARGYVIAPPLREEQHREALWQGLRDGHLSVVSSDHCPYCLSEKNARCHADFRQIPNGGPGIEHRMQILYSEGVAAGNLTLEQYVRITAEGPARQFGLYPRKGVLAVGADADLVILDPEGATLISASTQWQRVDYTPYEGWRLTGAVERVYSRGELLVLDGEFVAGVSDEAPARGRFLVRQVIDRMIVE